MKSTFGELWEDSKGYYRIISKSEGNVGKYFHRVVYENYHKVTLLPNIVIHHKDGNNKNNCILNLEAMTNEDHSLLHSDTIIAEPYDEYLKKIREKYV